jgi:uncharacterized protein with GYD domain
MNSYQRNKGVKMETYIIHSEMTEKGLSEIANIPLAAEEIGQKLKEQGGELKGFYKTMGVIDYVAIIEAPNDKIALAAVMAFALTGYFNGTTLKAFTMQQMKDSLEITKKFK